jgi:hypothetical protein
VSRNNCPSGQVSYDYVTVTVEADQFCGYTSQSLANHAAYIEAISQAQNQANNAGSCVTLTYP